MKEIVSRLCRIGLKPINCIAAKSLLGILSLMQTPSFSEILTSFIDQFASAVAERVGAHSSSGSNRGNEAARSASKARSPVQAHPGAGVPKRRRKGGKRPAEVIEQTTSALLAHIKENAGQRIEQIAKALKTQTSDLKLSAIKLLAAKKVKTKGERRGTTYHPA